MATKTLDELEQFKIKSGTRALGVEYEDKMTAYFSLLLAQDPKVHDFKISSNDPEYGNFDDLVVQVHYTKNDLKQTAAIQLKHQKDGRLVSIESFLNEKGDFSLLKYFKETEEKEIPEDVCLVLFTNRKFYLKQNEKSTIKLGAEQKTEVTLEIFQIEEKKKPEIIKSIKLCTSGNVYQFKLNKHGEKGEENFEKFLKRLYFYPCQDDVNGIESKLKEQFLGQPTHEQFVKFVENWSKAEKKFKLNKGTIISKFMECLLWPHSVHLRKDISGQEILFDKVFSKFDVTVFEQFISVIQGYDNKFIDAKEAKISWREKQQFGLSKQTDVIRLLWHLNEIPLIIKSECPKEILRKVLNLPKEETYGRRLVVVGKVDEEFKDRRILRNLSDFAKDELEEHFKDSQISLQGSKCPLLEYVSNDSELSRIFCTNEIVRLLEEESIFLGEDQRDLFPYIDRLLQKPIIRWDVLKVKSDSEIFVVSCNGRRGDFTAREQIIVFDTCSAQEFTEICAENEDKNVHHFQITEKINLSWIATKGSIKELTGYLSQIKDEVVVDSEILNNFTNKVNVLCAEPGMGKSVLMEFLKQNCSKDFWPILINIREYVKTFKENPFDQIVNKIIAKKFKRKDLTAEVVEIMNNRQRILLLWDGLDEAPQDFYEYFLEGVKLISEKRYFQWVTSRNHLKNMLEQKLHVFALTLKQLDEDNQRFYIRKTLNCNDEREKQIMTHLKNSLHRDLLGTPLQLLILTEIYRNDNNAQDFISLTDMYCKFVEMKFEVFNRKISNATENTLLQKELDYLNKKLLPEYEMFGVLACFEESLVKKLKVTSESHMDLINKIKEEGDRRGLVVGLLEDGIPLFIHQTYAEYFCALYLKENISRIGNFLSEVLVADDKYQTIRYMLDILLANGSKPHIDVIYGNVEMFKEWVCSPENESVEGSRFKDSHSGSSLHKIRNTQNRAIRFSNDRSDESSHNSLSKDLIGRSPVELACVYYHFGAYCILPQKVKSNMYKVQFYKRESEKNELNTKMREKIQAKEFYDIHKFQTLNIFLHCEKVTSLYPLEVLLRLDNSEANKSRIKNLQIFRKYFCTYILCCLRNGFESLLSLVKNIPSMQIRADIYSRNNNLLHFVAKYGRSESALTKLLAMTDLDINDRNSDSNTPLIEALQSRTPHQGIIKTFIENKADLDASRKFTSETALMTACERGNADVAKLLVEKGAAVNSQNNHGATAILLAAWGGYQDIVNFLLGNGADLNLKNKDGDSPLVYAIQNRFNSSFINKFIEAGADVNAKDEYGCTPLLMLKFYGYAEIANRLILDTGNAVDIDHQNLTLEALLLRASRKGHTAIVKALIAERININAKSTRGETSLLLAIRCYHLDIAKLLIQKGADVDAQDVNGKSPLLEAAEREYDDIVNILIEKGANLNEQNKEGDTPLILALKYNYTENKEAVVNILLEAGADVNIKNKKGDSPLLLAIEKGYGRNIINEIIRKGADVNAKDIFGNTPLLMLKFYGPTKTFKKLTSENGNSVDINNQNLGGESLLLRASSSANLKHVRILIKKKIDVNVRGTWGETPLLLAIASNHWLSTKIVDLCAKGADVCAQDVNGNSALHVAAANGHTDVIQTPPLIYAVNCSWKYNIDIDIVKTLIEAGANINQQNKDGNTPLILALKSTHEYRINIIKILIEAGANIDVQNKNGDTPNSIAESLADESIMKILRERRTQT